MRKIIASFRGTKRMNNKIESLISNIKKEVLDHKLLYISLAIVFLIGLFIRTYRADQILGFYYDEGRDAKEIWELWHEADLFLIGPTTGIAGIFRGPFYYYLIAPLYLLGRGDPVFPAYFLAFLTMIAIVILYHLGKTIQDRATGFMAAVIGAFSHKIMVDSRWLSNPTPMFLLSVVLLWMMVFVAYTPAKKLKNIWWIWGGISFVAGLSLFHFGSSGEFFYFPAIIIFGIWQLLRRKEIGLVKAFREVWGGRAVALVLGLFLFTASPLILFDFLKGHILSNNLQKFFLEEESFKASFWDVIKIRFPFYYSEFSSKIFHDLKEKQDLIMASIGIFGLIKLPKMLKNDGIKVVILMMLSPLIGLLFFQGNQGNVYGYYLTGYFLIFILLVAIILGQAWKHILGKVAVLFFFYTFLLMSFTVNRYYIIAGVDGDTTIRFGNEKQAVEWVYEDAAGRDFNVDVYVPPVIPHAYDYLFTWYGHTRYDNPPIDERIELLYIVSEADPPHPERRTNWDVRQQGIGSVEEKVNFGGITVERRHRFMDRIDEY